MEQKLNRRITIFVDAVLSQQLTEYANQNYETFASLSRRALIEFLKNHKHEINSNQGVTQ